MYLDRVVMFFIACTIHKTIGCRQTHNPSPPPVLFPSPEGRNRRRRFARISPPSPPFRAGESDGGA